MSPARKSFDREKLLQRPADPEVFFDNGVRQAFALRGFGEYIGAVARRHPGDPVHAACSAIFFATS